jgi:hypothetical protein
MNERRSPRFAPFNMASTAFIPPEIILLIIATPNIDLADLLRCTRVSKDWRSLIYDSNTLRAKLFLPPRFASGDLVAVKDPRYLAPASVEVYIDIDPADQKPCQEVMARAPLDGLVGHPLLLHHRIEDYSEIAAFALNYPVLRRLYDAKQDGATSWKEMCVTEPPLSCINLTVEHYRCGATFWGTTTKLLRNPLGVTIEDLFEGMWCTELPRNMGLVADDGSCGGWPWGGADSEPTCRCHDNIGREERAHAEVELIREKQRIAEAELEKAEALGAETEARFHALDAKMKKAEASGWNIDREDLKGWKTEMEEIKGLTGVKIDENNMEEEFRRYSET